ncbi:heterokaryon incompatibility protein-domain-containing protein [Aspergillus sergii]|uniref:Heterokaryon incompatibility protein-domain-containing protein n=1 Tax=Aspergillus sergii TaxID=1034303 RepID=A0A5N6XLM2_9EURO|nr:heterokaryon incompatibility protein-domain-containing protein [Aspergillus sergii]
MNSSILKDCPVCHNFQPEPEESITRIRGSPVQNFRKVLLPTNAAGELGFDIEVEIEDVHNQASNACNGCVLLYQGFQYLAAKSGSVVEEDQLYINVRSAPGQAIECSILARNDYTFPRTWKFQIFAVDGYRSPWKTMGKTTRSPRYVLNDEHRDWYLSWVQDCVENHPKCQRPSAMPTRLIDLGYDDKGTMCLRDEINQTSRYIALSHSWQFSEARKCMTLKKNYESRKRSIQQQGLSQTFQDAIQVARWLGVRYLWIDTFCIIQDDPDDWAEQASRMGEIFEGAYITIAVNCDLDSPPTDGCFLERNIVHEVALTDANGDEFLVVIRYRAELHHSLDYGPSLMRRGWCVQERLLSPRILHFRPWEVMFECFNSVHCECEKMPLDKKRHWRVRSNKEGLADILRMSGHGQELNGDKCWEVWRDVVRLYSGADLTVPTDRLAALSSMAQRMPRQIFGDYLAGLWSKNLIQELIWRRDHMRKDKFFRYKQYVAPSFSWASIYGGSVDIDWRFDGNMEPKASLLDAGTVPATADPMGPILEGFIHMRLHICEANIISTSIKLNEPRMNLAYKCQDGQVDKWYAFVDAEDDREELVGQKVYLGYMFKGSRSFVFLVLREVVDRKGVFQRIGIGRLSWEPSNPPGPVDPFYQVPEQEIRLI